MRPIYESMPYDLEIYYRSSGHFIPHMHELVEVIYILYGTLEIGQDDHLYHMEKGDLAVIFPGKIHHAQCFDREGLSASMYLLASTSLTGDYAQRLSTLQPENPVIPAGRVHEDAIYALRRLYRDYGIEDRGLRSSELLFPAPNLRAGAPAQEDDTGRIVQQSLLQLLLSRALPQMKLAERPDIHEADLEYQIVSYMAEHYREPMTLGSLAQALYVSPYRLSRTFSSTFHTNFNSFLNDMRLDDVCGMLRYSDKSITEIMMDAGFESQRTFNRVFQEKMHMSPREYRRRLRELPEEKEGSDAGSDINLLREPQGGSE